MYIILLIYEQSFLIFMRLWKRIIWINNKINKSLLRSKYENTLKEKKSRKYILENIIPNKKEDKADIIKYNSKM